MYKVKRIYDDPVQSDGIRVLIDRLWPRGVSKEQAVVTEWLKEIAPSPELREWFGHRPERFEEFRARYRDELAGNPAVGQLRKLAAEGRDVTLLYAAKDKEVNHAVVLLEFLQQK